MRIRLIVILSFFFSVASSQIVNKFNDSTWFKRSVQMDSFLRITKGAQYGYFLMSDSIGRGVWNPVGAVSFNAANGLSKSGDTAKFGGEITEDTEVYFNTPDSTHMGITFLPNGVVSLPAPTLVFGERTNDGNVNGIGVVNIPSTLYFTQIGYTDRARGEFSFRPNTGESSIEFEVTRDSDSYLASLNLTPEQLTCGGYVSGDYYLNLDAFMKAYQIGSMNDSTFLSVESENKAAYFIADSGCLIKNLNNDSVRVWVTDSAHIQSNKPLVVNAENGLSIKGANENSGYVLTSDAQRDKIVECLQSADVVCSRFRYMHKSIEAQYLESQLPEYWELFKEAIVKLYPQYKRHMIWFTDYSICNYECVYVMENYKYKQLVEEYFSIMEYIWQNCSETFPDKNVKQYNCTEIHPWRYPGFLNERFVPLFFYANGLRKIEVPFAFLA